MHQPEAIEKAALLSQLAPRWCRHAHVIIDEIDQACNIAQEVNDATGQPKAVDPELRGVIVDIRRAFSARGPMAKSTGKGPI